VTRLNIFLSLITDQKLFYELSSGGS